MPGLLGGIARTAVVSATATAVSNRVSRRQAGRWAAQDQQASPPPPQQFYAQEPGSPPESGEDRLGQLRELGELKQSGVLSDAEFEAEKRRILDS